MTSVIKIDAHCSDEKEVVVKIFDSVSNEVKEEVVLQDGQSTQKHVYDNLVVATTERLKSTVGTDESQEGGDQGDSQTDDSGSGKVSNARAALESLHAARETPAAPQQK